MIETIKKYYIENHIPPIILDAKIESFRRNPDIAAEFIHWIEEGCYQLDDKSVAVEGYTAKSLAKLSDYLNGDGAFLLLIELRENKEKAMRRIENGFRMK